MAKFAIMGFGTVGGGVAEVLRLNGGAIAEKLGYPVVLRPAYGPGCYRVRNDFLVEHVAIMLAYWDGLPYGGTYYTIGKAQMLNRIIINLYK